MESYAYGIWLAVVLNVALFGGFVYAFLRPKKRREWRSLGVFAAFITALFTEMYGFPLTIYLLSGLLGRSYPALDPFSHKFGHLWVVALGGSDAVWAAVTLVSTALIWGGLLVMWSGWQAIHSASGELVTTGAYARVRHPQYAGLLVLIVGFLIQWPTILTVAMAPILAHSYVRLARREETELLERFGVEYERYRARVPAFVPRFRQHEERWGRDDEAHSAS